MISDNMKLFICFFGVLYFIGYAKGDEFPPLALVTRNGGYKLEAFESIKKNFKENKIDPGKPIFRSILCCFSDSMDKAAYNVEVNSISNTISKVITRSTDLEEDFFCKKKYVPSIRISAIDTKDMTLEIGDELIIFQSGYEVCDFHNLLHGTGLPTLNDEICEFFPTLDILYDKINASVKQVRYELAVDKEDIEYDEPCENLDLGIAFFDANMKVAYSLHGFKPQLLAPVQHFRDESLKLPICSYLNTAPTYVGGGVDDAWKEVQSFIRKVAMVAKIKLNIIIGTYQINENDPNNVANENEEMYILHQVPVPEILYAVLFYRVDVSEKADNEYDHFGMIVTVINTPNGISSQSEDYFCDEIPCEMYYNKFGMFYRNSLIRCCVFNDFSLQRLRIRIKGQGRVINRVFSLSSFRPDKKSLIEPLNIAEDMDLAVQGFRKREDIPI